MKFSSILGLSIYLVLLMPGAPAAQEHPDLSGVWNINRAKSDNLARIFLPGGSGNRQGTGSGNRGGEHRGRGGKRGGGGGMRNSGNGNGQAGREQLEQLKREYARLEIFQDGAEVDVTNGLDITQLFFADGNPTSIWSPQGMVQAHARWVADTLVVDWQNRQATAGRVRRYRISEDGRTLAITEERRLPSREDPIVVHLVYDKVDR